MTNQILATVPITLGDRRILVPGKLLWLRACAWMVVLFFLVLFAFAPTIRVLGPLLPKDPRISFMLNVGAALIALGAYLLFVRLGEDRLADELKPAALPQLLVGLAIGAAMFACVMGILVAAKLYRIDWHGLAPAWKAAGISIQAGVGEEILVRAIMLRLLWRAFGPVAAFVVSALFFGGAHLTNPGATLFAGLCIALEAGVMLGAFYALTGRLWMSIGVHAAWNFTQGYVFGAAVSGTSFGTALSRSTVTSGAPAWASGGAFGPEASFPALVVCFTVGLVVLWYAYKAGRFGAADGARPDAGATA
jgi:hypothetical protein